MNLTESIMNLIFPSTCGVCHEIAKDFLCPKCKRKLQKLQTLKKQIKIRKDEDYTMLSVFSYQDKIQKLLVELKFYDGAILAKMFAKILAENEKICRFLKSYDIIIPVPVFFTRKWERGYNQTERIAKELQKQIPDLLIDKNSLQKVKNTKRQSQLSKNERKANLQNAYKVKSQGKLNEKSVLLLDDIYTTRKYDKELCASTSQSRSRTNWSLGNRKRLKE